MRLMATKRVRKMDRKFSLAEATYMQVFHLHATCPWKEHEQCHAVQNVKINASGKLV